MKQYLIGDYELSTEVSYRHSGGVMEMMTNYLPWNSVDLTIKSLDDHVWMVVDNHTDFQYKVTEICEF